MDISELQHYKARLLDLDAVERLQRLASRLIGADDPNALLAEILDAAIAITEADFGNVQIFDPASGDLRIVVHRGFPASWVEFWNRASRGQGAGGTALERNERVLIEDVAGSPIFDETALAVQREAGVRAMQSTPLFSRSGEPLGMISTHFRDPRRPSDHALRFMDVLARQAADFLDRTTALQRSEATFAGIMMTSADGIISVDPKQRIVLFNKVAEEIFGYTSAEVLGMPLRMLIPERFHAIHHQQVAGFGAGPPKAQAMGRGRPGIVGRRKNGEEFVADISISKVQVSGEVVLTATVRDATDQHLLAAVGLAFDPLEIQAPFDRIATLLAQHIGDFCVVFAVDETGSLRPEAAACREPADAPLANLVMTMGPPPPTHPAHRCFLERKAAIIDLREEQYERFSEGPERLAVMRAAVARYGVVAPLVLGDRCLGVVAVSSRSHAYNERAVRSVEAVAQRAVLFVENARLRAAEQRATRMRDDVLGVVAHDLRNPLGNILLQTELLRHRREQDERGSKRPADAIHRAGTRMQRIIDDLLDVTQLDAGRLTLTPAAVSPQDLVAEVVTSQAEACAVRSLELKANVPANLRAIWIDRARVLQVFENLVGNAMKFTQAGSITVGAKADERGSLFWVADTGAGISKDDQTHLFDRFWQARGGPRAGAGLGLTIARGIVEAHGGRMWVESEPGQGATFWFTLPVAAAQVTGAAGSERSVLVAEDDPDLRDAMVELLQHRGYDVMAVANGQEALDRLHGGSRPRLMIIDLAMPVLDGWGVLAERERDVELRSVPVIVVSGQRDVAERVVAAHARFVAKPVAFAQLLEVMDELTKPVEDRARA